jgi:HNH endonuclease
MEFKLHRVASNSESWVRPSPRRLGAAGVGEYVRAQGFGHEDWNFNFGLASDEGMIGYTVARPSSKLKGEKFGVILATYDTQGWKAVGYYNGAQFKEQTGGPPDIALEQMAIDVFELAEKNQISDEYRGKTLSEIEQVIRTEFVHHCWSIPTAEVFVFELPRAIPKSVFNPGIQRMTVSFNISEAQFNRITRLDAGPTDRYRSLEHTEGERTLRLHQVIERRPALVSAFKNSLTSFACAVCSFDFEDAYGEIGNAFIECHHTKPVATMRSGQVTKLTDLAAVCSNCHRMLHRAVPMLTVEQLRNMHERASNKGQLASRSRDQRT